MIQNSGESKHVYGASVSGPVFKEVADKLYATRIAKKSFNPKEVLPDNYVYQFSGMKDDLDDILKVFNYRKTDSSASAKWRTSLLQYGNAKLLADPVSATTDKVPLVSGMGLKDAVYWLENRGLKVSATGRGKVVYQSIAQNTDFKKGESIKIQLN